MNKKTLFISIITVALLTLVSFSNVVGYQSVKNTREEIIGTEFDIEYCQNYLFETIVQMSNNQDIMNLPIINNYNQKIPSPFNINTETLSVEHLELLYNLGLKIKDRLGEDKILEVIGNVEIEKPEFVDDIESIITGDEELRDRIYTLNQMNIKSDKLDWYFTIICYSLAILLLLVMPLTVTIYFLQMIRDMVLYFYPNALFLKFIVIFFYGFIISILSLIVNPLYFLFYFFKCI